MRHAFPALAATALLAACASSPSSFTYQVPADEVARGAKYMQPEGSSGFTPKPGWATKKFAVAAANPLATDAGYQVLKAGGSAIDAAIAVQMVLTLVEPQSSGIGGGAFLLHASGGKVEAFDGRETAPAAADEKLFIGADGKPMAFYDGVVGGRSVGTPGTVRMLEMAHKQYGRLPWAQLFAPAIQLAEGGFKVSPRLNTLLKGEVHLKKDATAAAYFYKPDGSPVDVGATLRNPALAEVLRRIAAEGSSALLEGQVAQAIVAKVQGHATNPGKLALADLAGYQPKKRDPICSDYSAAGKAYRLCGMPPPSSGAIAVGQILGILNNTPASHPGPGHRQRRRSRHGLAHTLGRLAAPVHRGLAPGLRRPRPVPGRPGLRAAAGRQLDEPAGPGLPGRARQADTAHRPQHEDRQTRRAGRRQDGLRAHARPARVRHLAHQHRRRLRQRHRHDDHD